MVAYGYLHYELQGTALYRNVGDIEYILVYVISPILGGGFGAVAYRYVDGYCFFCISQQTHILISPCFLFSCHHHRPFDRYYTITRRDEYFMNIEKENQSSKKETEANEVRESKRGRSTGRGKGTRVVESEPADDEEEEEEEKEEEEDEQVSRGRGRGKSSEPARKVTPKATKGTATGKSTGKGKKAVDKEKVAKKRSPSPAVRRSSGGLRSGSTGPVRKRK